MHKGSSILSKFGGKSKAGGEGKQKTWLHTPETLTQSFAVYQAKLLGVLAVNQSKGVDVVKDAIKKLKLAHEINKSEAGNKGSKLAKVELWISVDLLKVLHTKTKVVLHQKPLHRVSYCADDHFDTKLFSFIAKNEQTGGHECFVFITEKEASELTFTVGQAFELAYQRYLQKRGAADLMRSRETARQKELQNNSQPANEVTNQIPPGNNNVTRTLEQAPPKEQENFLVDLNGGVAKTNSRREVDQFEQYLASVASRGIPTKEEPVQESVNSVEPGVSNSVSLSNPFDDIREMNLPAAGRSSPQLPRPKPSGNSLPVSSAPHALPKPPSKQDIKMSRTIPKNPTGSQIQAQTSSSNDPLPTNPFQADNSQLLELQNAHIETPKVNSDMFDPFG